MIFKTDNHLKVVDSCYRAHHHQKLLVVQGAKGLGKTTALECYAEENANVILLRVAATSSLRSFLKDLNFSLRDDQKSSEGVSNFQLLTSVINGLTSSANVQLLILDGFEAQPDLLFGIAMLWEHLNGTIGMILSSRETLYSDLTKTRHSLRIDGWTLLGPPTRKDVRMFCDHYGTPHTTMYPTSKNFLDLQNNINWYLKYGTIKGKLLWH
jgi:hypothetical protein